MERFLSVTEAALLIASHIAGRDPISLLADLRRGRGETVYPHLRHYNLPRNRIGYRQADLLNWIDALPALTPRPDVYGRRMAA